LRNAARALLLLIAKQNNKITRIRLVKLAFLTSREICVGKKFSFYEFVPYQYGPFSFCLYKDLVALSKDGWISQNGNSVKLEKNGSELQEQFKKLPSKLKSAVELVTAKTTYFSDDFLVDSIYQTHPEYTYYSKIASDKPPKPVAPIQIYTIGYQGFSVDGFLNHCVQRGIQRIIDVRNVPFSMSWDFCKKPLSNFCNKLEIEYLHYPQLGIPGNKRKCLKSNEDYLELFDYYENSILPTQEQALDQIGEIIRTKPSALLCMEQSPQMCHRSRLAEALSRRLNLDVCHLTVQ